MCIDTCIDMMCINMRCARATVTVGVLANGGMIIEYRHHADIDTSRNLTRAGVNGGLLASTTLFVVIFTIVAFGGLTAPILRHATCTCMHTLARMHCIAHATAEKKEKKTGC